MKVLLILGLYVIVESILVPRMKKKKRKQDSFDSLLDDFKKQQTKGMDENSLYRIFRTIGLTYGESKYIYNLMDIEKNKEISQSDFWHFYDIFIDGFKKCGGSVDNNYMLTKVEIESDDCRFMQWGDNHIEPFIHVDAKNGSQTIVDYMGMRGQVNFWGYLVTWKVLQAMQECGDNRVISRVGVKCAFKILSKRKLLTDSDGYETFRVLTFLKYGIDKGYDQYLDFKEFMVLGSSYIMFSEFGVLSHDTTIHKRELLQAMDEQKFSNYLDRNSVDVIYQDRKELQFGQFTVGYVLHRLFNSYDKNADFRIEEEEWVELSSDTFINQWAVYWIDHISFTTQDIIDQVDTKIKDKQEYSIKDYLAYGRRMKHKKHKKSNDNDKNDKMKLKKHRTRNKKSNGVISNIKLKMKRKDGDDEVDPEKRGAIMKMYEYGPGKVMKFKQFYDLMTCMFSFVMQDDNYNGSLDSMEIQQIYQNPKGYLQLDFDKQQSLLGLLQFLDDKKTFQLDIREYLMFFSYDKLLKLGSLTPSSGIMGRKTVESIGLDSFKLIFNDNIFNKCASKIQLDKEVKPSDLTEENEQIYNGPLCFKTAITYEMKAKRYEDIAKDDQTRKMRKKE